MNSARIPFLAAALLLAAVALVLTLGGEGAPFGGSAAPGAAEPPSAPTLASGLDSTEHPQPSPHDPSAERRREEAPPPAARAASPPPREDLRGRVVDADSRAPLADVRVVVREERGTGSVLATLTTDAEGRFELSGLGAHHDVRLHLALAGHLPSSPQHATGLDRDFALERGRSLAGRVLWRSDRAPVPNAELRLLGVPSRWNGQELGPLVARTDAEGRFALDALPRDRVSLLVRAEGTLGEQQSVPGDVEALDLLLDPVDPLPLRLVDLDTGVPLVDHAVELGEWPNALATFTLRTDGAGLLRLSVPRALEPEAISRELERRSWWRIQPEGWCATIVPLAALGEEATDVPCARGAIVQGNVRDPEGNAVAEASVALAAHCPEPGLDLPLGMRIDTARSSTRTGADGSYRLSSVWLPCTDGGRLSGSSEGWESTSATLSGPLTAGLVSVDLTLREGLRSAIHGRITLAGEPLLGGVTVSQAKTASQAALWRQTLCNARGEYALEDLRPGPLRLRVYRSPDGGDRLHQEELDLAPGLLEHDLTLTEALPELRGVVVDENDRPMAEAAVFDQDDDRMTFEEGGFVQQGGRHVQTRSARDGTFAIRLDPEVLPLSLRARRGAAQSRPFEVSGLHEVVRLELPPTGSVRLEVHDSEGNRPARLRSLLGWSAGAPPTSEPAFALLQPWPESDGTFALELPAGSWDLKAVAADRPTGWLRGLRVAPGTERGALLELPAGCTVELRLHGAPVGAGVTVTEAFDDGAALVGMLGRPFRSQAASPEGALTTLFTEPLAPGRYVLTPRPDDWTLRPASLDVGFGEHATLDVTWTPEEP